MIYDRIDLVAIGTWANNFRPTGLTITFGSNVSGGYTSSKTLTNVTLPYGSLVNGVKLTTTNIAGGTAVPNGVSYASVSDVIVPFGVKFNAQTTIDGITYPAGTYLPSTSFTMNTVQLIDVQGNVIFSVHGTESNELITFKRPVANIRRLIMYKDGIGVDTAPFACYSIVFKTSATLAEVNAFNKAHPSDTNPIIIDDGSVLNPKYLLSI